MNSPIDTIITAETPEGIAIIARDISDRKRADAERDELNAALRREKESLRLSEERFSVGQASAASVRGEAR